MAVVYVTLPLVKMSILPCFWAAESVLRSLFGTLKLPAEHGLHRETE